MLKQFIQGRVYVFIDAENIFYSQRTLGWKISYRKLMAYLKEECGVDMKCFFYTGRDESNEQQKKFIDMLALNNYIVRTKAIKKIRLPGGQEHWKSNLDMELAFEMVETKDKYDIAILFSGDSDFSLPIDRIKAAGKRIFVFSTRGHVARELLDRAKFVDIRKLKDRIAL